MTQPLFLPAALADMEEAFRWYEARQRGLGNVFLASIDRALAGLIHQPEMNQAVHGDTRRVLLAHFPYALYYRIRPQGVVIVACFHARRDPVQWRDRD